MYDPFAPKKIKFAGITPHLHRKMNILALPDELRHLIIKYIFDVAIVARGENRIEWNVKKHDMCCDAQDMLW